MKWPVSDQDRAIPLLKETPMSISQVALECGFSDAAYFSRFIRKKTGKNPQEIRREPEPLSRSPVRVKKTAA